MVPAGRFNSGFFYKHELLQPYRYYWRVEYVSLVPLLTLQLIPISLDRASSSFAISTMTPSHLCKRTTRHMVGLVSSCVVHMTNSVCQVSLYRWSSMWRLFRRCGALRRVHILSSRQFILLTPYQNSSLKIPSIWQNPILWDSCRTTLDRHIIYVTVSIPMIYLSLANVMSNSLE